MKKIVLLSCAVFIQTKTAEKEVLPIQVHKSPVIRSCPALSPEAIEKALHVYQLELEEAKKAAELKAQQKMCETHSSHASSEKIRTLVYKMLLFCDHKKPHRVYVCNYTNKEHGSGCYRRSRDNKLWGCINYNEQAAKNQNYGYKILTLFREVWKLTQLQHKDKELEDLTNEDIENLEFDADKQAMRATSCFQCHEGFRQRFIQETDNIRDFKFIFDEIVAGKIDQQEYQKIVENYLKIAVTKESGIPTQFSLKRAFALSKASKQFGNPCQYHASPLHQTALILNGNRVKTKKIDTTSLNVLTQMHSL